MNHLWNAPQEFYLLQDKKSKSIKKNYSSKYNLWKEKIRISRKSYPNKKQLIKMIRQLLNN